MSEEKVTAEEFARIVGPLFASMVKQHGKTNAIRMFRQTVVELGYDPNEFRVVFSEDLS